MCAICEGERLKLPDDKYNTKSIQKEEENKTSINPSTPIVITDTVTLGNAIVSMIHFDKSSPSTLT